MSPARVVLLVALAWVMLVTLLHAWLNLRVLESKPMTEERFRVGFLPVT